MSGYIGTQPVPQATQTRDAFTATAAQTSFATGGYTPGFLDVFLNGVKLAAADYTATNGSDVVLAVGAALNDIIETVAYTTFEVNSNATLAQGALADTALQPTGDGSGLTSLTSANLTGALPAIDGSSLTGVVSLIKAWVNFNGTGTVAIGGSFNVSSITDIAAGRYRINFTVAMADINYVPVMSVVGHSDALTGMTSVRTVAGKLVGSCEMTTASHTGGAVDRAEVNFMAVGN